MSTNLLIFKQKKI